MKVKGLIISDTHWYSTNEIPNFLFDLVKQFDFMIHAGDWTDSESVDLFSSLTYLFLLLLPTFYSFFSPILYSNTHIYFQAKTVHSKHELSFFLV